MEEAKRIVLKKVPDEQCHYSFEDEVGIDPNSTELLLTGNRNYQSFGDPALLKVTSHDYCDDDVGYDYSTLEELEKLTGKEWGKTTIRGYSQGDWQNVYYVEGSTNYARIEEISDYYFGKIDEFRIIEGEDEVAVACVPHHIRWKGKKATCEYLGLDPNEVTMLVDDGYEKVYKYKEVE